MSIFSLINVSVSSLAHLLKKNTDKDGKEAKPGDLIEIIRGNYSHWAVYVGNGYVVHFGAPNAQSGSSTGGVDGIVMKDKLEDVAGKDKWRVNNSLDKKYNPLPPDEIVKKACSLVEVSLKYHLTTYNCEHFATEMRYGKAESRQVLQTVQSTVATVAGNAVGGIPGIIITLIGLLRQRSTS
ncbi:HRAS-like suppressor 3 [Oryzias latipes]|uniref:LRAT domain-containing protein n=1 Tax=Oryzias latipes TaxID=8090 RepID=A0A3B3HMT0_ORYLA|nr:HRAS-like suppressor 3 [Oryzias latipes]XP_020556713.1 HRAS-like suppressor 3 [Oryzias latipes]XP_020556714.1 HRAS-like suppressor 3 [Oryzias latipes]